MTTTKCTICGHPAKIIFNKKGYDYYECSHCKSIFVPDGIDQSNMVGGEHEVGRNENENATRIERIKELVGKYGRVLDWGCGHGYLVKDLKEAGMDAVGYDKFNPDFDKIPEGHFNLICLIEVVEHLSDPFNELDIIYQKLLPNGILKLETSFVDVALEEGIPLESFFYISPTHGHSTIFSHYGMDRLMIRKGFKVVPPINRNVRIFQKKTN